MSETPCNERVGRGTFTWPCSLPTKHDGPHYAIESTSSMGERRRWEASQSAAAQEATQVLRSFQGEAQTTAQRYTENPTPVPGAEHFVDDAPTVTLGPGDTLSIPLREVVISGDGALGESITVEMREPGRDPHEHCQVPDLCRSRSCIVYADLAQQRGLTPTKQREGDQVLPNGSDVCAQDLVIEAMQESKRVGIERYGQTLRTFNGRRGFVDVHDEVRDLFVYLTMIKAEAEATRETLVKVVTDAMEQVENVSEEVLTYDEMAEIAVDRIMGWVVGQR